MSKKYNVYGIGNAIVDIVTEVEDEFFVQHGIEKGLMTLVDEARQIQLMDAISQKDFKMHGGGSAGNTLVALSQLGGSAYYNCVVANDALGKFYLEDLKQNNVDTALTTETLPEGHSGRCLVMTSPDAMRTMNTYLGISATITSSSLNEEIIQQAEYVYLEGYLVPSPNGLETLIEAKRLAKKNNVKVALTFSDPSMVKYFGEQMAAVIGEDGVDLLFANDEEAMLFTKTSTLAEAKEALKAVARQFVITIGADGAILYDGQQFIEVEPFPVQAVDTNGAGDMFAGAFLYGISKGWDFATSGKLACLAASKIVTNWGARLEKKALLAVAETLKLG
jgi:sugar/nucleoside kinase (ribokinase family)